MQRLTISYFFLLALTYIISGLFVYEYTLSFNAWNCTIMTSTNDTNTCTNPLTNTCDKINWYDYTYGTVFILIITIHFIATILNKFWSDDSKPTYNNDYELYDTMSDKNIENDAKKNVNAFVPLQIGTDLLALLLITCSSTVYFVFFNNNSCEIVTTICNYICHNTCYYNIIGYSCIIFVAFICLSCLSLITLICSENENANFGYHIV